MKTGGKNTFFKKSSGCTEGGKKKSGAQHNLFNSTLLNACSGARLAPEQAGQWEHWGPASIFLCSSSLHVGLELEEGGGGGGLL